MTVISSLTRIAQLSKQHELPLVAFDAGASAFALLADLLRLDGDLGTSKVYICDVEVRLSRASASKVIHTVFKDRRGEYRGDIIVRIPEAYAAEANPA